MKMHRLAAPAVLALALSACSMGESNNYSNASPVMPFNTGMAGDNGVSYACAGGKTLTSMYNPTGLGVQFQYDGKTYRLPAYTSHTDEGYEYGGYSNDAMIDYVIDKDQNVSSLKLNGTEQGPCVGAWHGTAMQAM
ncbi:MAG: hypothetical protein KDG89_17065 [Geminicoccaceae bacterium]|nr:hypothetical protein [Geminicoccaceae bacterium]